MNQRLKVLAIVPFPLFPVQSGGQRRTTSIFQEFSNYWDINCITVKGAISTESLPYLIHDWLLVSPLRYLYFPILFKILPLAKKADLIWVDQPFWGFWGILISLITGKPLLIQAHNIEYLRFKSLAKKWWHLVKWIERFIFSKADYIVFISDQDAKDAQRLLNVSAEKILVLPYGLPFSSVPECNSIAVQELKNQLIEREDSAKLILFYGVLSYEPNAQAVEFLIEKILPFLRNKSAYQFKILIAGKGASDSLKQLIHGQPDCKLLGFVEDIETLLFAVDVVVNPVLTGGGVKTKVIEALGLNIPVVSTETGAIGVDPKVCGNKLKIVSDYNWELFADQVIETFKQKSRIPIDFFEQYSLASSVKKVAAQLKIH